VKKVHQSACWFMNHPSCAVAIQLNYCFLWELFLQNIVMKIHNTFIIHFFASKFDWFPMVFMGFSNWSSFVLFPSCQVFKINFLIKNYFLFFIFKGGVKYPPRMIWLCQFSKRNSALVPFFEYLLNYLPNMGNNEISTRFFIDFCCEAILPLLTW